MDTLNKMKVDIASRAPTTSPPPPIHIPDPDSDSLQQPVLQSTNSFPLEVLRKEFLSHTGVKEQRRVSIDSIDTLKFQYNKSQEETELDRLAALKEVNVVAKARIRESISGDKVLERVVQLASTAAKSSSSAVTLVGRGDEQWDVAAKGIQGKDIPKDVYRQLVENPNETLLILDTKDDERFEGSQFGFYVGVALKHNEKGVGVLSIVDKASREDFSDLSIDILHDVSKLIVEKLVSVKAEARKQKLAMKELKLATLQMDARKRSLRRQLSSSPNLSPRPGLFDLEEVFTSWMESDIAQGDELSHLPWMQPWVNSYPKPPIANNDKDRTDAAKFYRSLIEEPTKILFNEMCTAVCQALNFPIAVLGIVTDALYYPEGMAGAELESVPREIVLCNYTIKKGSAFVVPDIQGSPFFNSMPMATKMGLGFYASAPLCTSDGYNIGTMCVCDVVARKDFDQRKQKQLTAFAAGFMRHLEMRRLKMLNLELNMEKERLSKQLTSNKGGAPLTGEVTFVCTDVESSTSLWECHPAEMNIALQIHDQIMRGCLSENYGYEIGTEGDSFELAFHSPVDAVRWCLQVQEKLAKVEWPAGLLNSDICKRLDATDGRTLFAGLRVRMGVNRSTEFEPSMQEVSQRVRYFGAGVNSVRTLSGFAYGGQILLSGSAFEGINGSLDNLGNPFIIDLGRHALDEECEMHIYQLLPTSLGPRYQSTTDNSGMMKSHTIEGRIFPMIKSVRVLSPSYFAAPRKGKVHQVFAVIDKKTRQNLVDSSLMRPKHTPISGIFAEILARHEGYICHEEHGSFMLAFHSAFNAANWCVDTMEVLKDPVHFKISHTPTVQMGIHSGKFEDCRPHPLTGRMYYFGAVVNRTARIAHKAADGQIFCSKETILELQTTTSAAQKKLFLVRDEGDFVLKGVTNPVPVCSIIRRLPETPSPLARREKSLSSIM